MSLQHFVLVPTFRGRNNSSKKLSLGAQNLGKEVLTEILIFKRCAISRSLCLAPFATFIEWTFSLRKGLQDAYQLQGYLLHVAFSKKQVKQS